MNLEQYLPVLLFILVGLLVGVAPQASNGVEVASVAVGSVALRERSLGEWRQVGDALSSVLHRVSRIAEASAQMTGERTQEGRMH